MQPGIGRVKIKFTHHRKSRDYGPEIKDQLQLQRSLRVSRPKNGIQYKVSLFLSLGYSSSQLFINVWGERTSLVMTGGDEVRSRCV